jgi:hypothetical protein
LKGCADDKALRQGGEDIVQVCMYACVHVCMYVCADDKALRQGGEDIVQVCMHVYMYVCMSALMIKHYGMKRRRYLGMYVCMCTCMYVCITARRRRLYSVMHVCMCTCMYICSCWTGAICLRIHTYILKHTHTQEHKRWYKLHWMLAEATCAHAYVPQTRRTYVTAKRKARSQTFELQTADRDAVLAALKRDVSFLERNGLMDYSLIAGGIRMLHKPDTLSGTNPPQSPNLGHIVVGPNLGRVNSMLRRAGSIVAGAVEDFPPGSLTGQPYFVDGKGSHRTAFYIGIIDYLQRCVRACNVCVCMYM